MLHTTILLINCFAYPEFIKNPPNNISGIIRAGKRATANVTVDATQDIR